MEAINNGRNIKMKASKCLGRWIKEMKNEIRKGKEKMKMEKRINIQRNTQKNKKNERERERERERESKLTWI